MSFALKRIADDFSWACASFHLSGTSSAFSCAVSRRPCAGNFVCAVSIGAEHPIVLVSRWTSKIRVDVFPDDLSGHRDLKQASEISLADQRISVRQPLRVGDP